MLLFEMGNFTRGVSRVHSRKCRRVIKRYYHRIYKRLSEHYPTLRATVVYMEAHEYPLVKYKVKGLENLTRDYEYAGTYQGIDYMIFVTDAEGNGLIVFFAETYPDEEKPFSQSELVNELSEEFNT